MYWNIKLTQQDYLLIYQVKLLGYPQVTFKKLLPVTYSS